ncbi:MAG: ankyrin repeat domain-containing protein [Burkholderiaceae bacterium]
MPTTCRAEVCLQNPASSTRRRNVRTLLLVLMTLLALRLAGTARAGDPFDDARYAIGIKDNATALRLIDSGQFDLNMQNGEGNTLLSFAAADGNLAMVDALLVRGADPAIKNNLGMTSLDRAIGTMVSVRLKQAMDAKAGVGGGGKQPPAGTGTGDFDKVRMAIGSHYNAVAVAELDKGIDVNMQNNEGFTLLHFASKDGNLVMVEELLRRGANPDIKVASGQTALDMAIGTMVAARLKAAGGKPGIGEAAAKSVPTAQKGAAGKSSSSPADQSPHAKMCASRHYSSSALCSDSTCKMREYRKWQTCLKTGSYY